MLDEAQADREINDYLHAFPMCCGARQVKLSGTVKDHFKGLAEFGSSENYWQALLEYHDFGLLVINKPSEGFTELVPGQIYYKIGEGWEPTSELKPLAVLTKYPTKWHLSFARIFGPLSGIPVNVISNFPPVYFDISSEIRERVEQSTKEWALAILVDSQRPIHEEALFSLGFKVATRFLNPYHSGSRCTLYARPPGELPK